MRTGREAQLQAVLVNLVFTTMLLMLIVLIMLILMLAVLIKPRPDPQSA